MARESKAPAKPEPDKQPEKKPESKAPVGHVVVRRFVAYGVKLMQGVRVDATNWPKLLPLLNAKFLRPATAADMDRPLVDVPAKL